MLIFLIIFASFKIQSGRDDEALPQKGGAFIMPDYFRGIWYYVPPLDCVVMA